MFTNKGVGVTVKGLSKRYTFVPTARIVTGLRELDWVPVNVEEQRIRLESRRGFQKHLLRFRLATQMETLDELARVLGMTPAVLAAIRPHLTLYGPQAPELAAADPIVAAAFDFVRKRPGGFRANVPRGRRGGVTTVRITATAHGPENAEVTRVAVIRFNPQKPYASAMLAWGPSIE